MVDAGTGQIVAGHGFTAEENAYFSDRPVEIDVEFLGNRWLLQLAQCWVGSGFARLIG